MSIIGNPILIGAGGGGGGGLDFNKGLIHVVATKGATVNFSTGGIIVKSIGPNNAFPKSTGGVADYYYSASNGTWTVAATNGTTSVSTTVVVSEIKEYDLELCYGYWVHRVGTGLMNDFTVTWSSTATSKVVDKNEISSVQNGSYACMSFLKSVNLSGYSSCNFEYVKEFVGNMESPYSPAKTGRFTFGTNTNTGDYKASLGLLTDYMNDPDSTRPEPTLTWTPITLDISGLSDSTTYFKFMSWNNGYMGIRNLYYL